jgi:hypothetical protein
MSPLRYYVRPTENSVSPMTPRSAKNVPFGKSANVIIRFFVVEYSSQTGRIGRRSVGTAVRLPWKSMGKKSSRDD